MCNFKVPIKVNPFLVIAITLFFITGHGIEYLCAFLSISIHEALHVCFAKCFNMKVYSIEILPAGLTAEIDETNANPKQKIIMYFFGPLSNMILFIITFSCSNLSYFQPNLIINTFYQINAYLAVFNLIPIFPLDGGKILFELIAKKKGLQITQKYVKTISFGLLYVILTVGIFQSYLFHNFNILIIGIYLAYLIKCTMWEAVFMNLKQLLFRRSRILKKGIYPVRTLVVMKNMTLGDVLKNMDFDGFHIVYVMDDMFKLINTYTEQDIIDGLIEYDNDITFEEFMKKKL